MRLPGLDIDDAAACERAKVSSHAMPDARRHAFADKMEIFARRLRCRQMMPALDVTVILFGRDTGELLQRRYFGDGR